MVAELSEEVRSELGKFNPLVGTNLRNPVDIPASTFASPEALSGTMRALAGWSGIDIVLVAFPVTFGLFMGVQYLIDGFRTVIETAREMGKSAVIILSTQNSAEAEIKVWELQKHCFRQGTPVYLTFAQSARAVNRLVSYYERATSEARH